LLQKTHGRCANISWLGKDFTGCTTGGSVWVTRLPSEEVASKAAKAFRGKKSSLVAKGIAGSALANAAHKKTPE
jgi:hypothetical protein